MHKKKKKKKKKKKSGSTKLRSMFQELKQGIKADIKKHNDFYVNIFVGDIKVNPQRLL